MTRIHIICEGQTEESFIKNLLMPYFSPLGIFLYPSLIGKSGHKGGTIKFDRLLIDSRIRLLDDREAFCTTFFDFYALPTNFPGKSEAIKKITIADKSSEVCIGLVNSLKNKMGDQPIQRFIPYVQMYEFEALLFSDPVGFANGIDEPKLDAKFAEIRQEFNTPEDINDSPHTAPSKRVEGLIPKYEKPVMGTLAALEIGLPKMRTECALFDNWLTKLEHLQD
jgi:hypothetical protein